LSTEWKLDIFELLKAIDKRDKNWLSQQSLESQKAFNPKIVLRWASTVPNNGTEAYYMLFILNERLNVHLWTLQKHPELLYKLFASCGIGKQIKRQWLGDKQTKRENNKAYNLLALHNTNASEKELDMLLSLYTKDTFSEFISECGLQPDVAKETLKAYEKLKHNT
jgi:hypothetical protein